MVSNVRTFLNNAFPIDKITVKEKKAFGWACKNNIVVYENLESADKKDKLEKIYSCMHQELKRLNRDTKTLKEQEKTELQQLKGMVLVNKQICKEERRGLKGKWQSIKARHSYGDLSKLTNKIIDDIDLLCQKELEKPVPNFDKFINAAAPIRKFDLNISMLNQDNQPKPVWIYIEKDNLIKRCLDADLPKTKEGKDYPQLTLMEVIGRMNEQLEVYQDLELISEIHRDQLKSLLIAIEEEALKKGHTSNLKEIGAVSQKIRSLIKLPAAPLPGPDKIKEMKFNLRKAKKELIETEASFLKQVQQSKVTLEHLIALRDNKKIKCSTKYNKFFKPEVTGCFSRSSKNKSRTSLDKSLEAYNELEILSKEVQKEINKALERKSSLHQSQELANLFESELFRNYTKTAALCARHGGLFRSFFQDLTDTNEIASLDLRGLNEKLKNEKIASDQPLVKLAESDNYFMAAATRLSRIQMVMDALLQNTLTHDDSYQAVLLAHNSVVHNAADLNVRLMWPFNP